MESGTAAACDTLGPVHLVTNGVMFDSSISDEQS